MRDRQTQTARKMQLGCEHAQAGSWIGQVFQHLIQIDLSKVSVRQFGLGNGAYAVAKSMLAPHLGQLGTPSLIAKGLHHAIPFTPAAAIVERNARRASADKRNRYLHLAGAGQMHVGCKIIMKSKPGLLRIDPFLVQFSERGLGGN